MLVVFCTVYFIHSFIHQYKFRPFIRFTLLFMHMIDFLLRMQFHYILNLNELWAALPEGARCSVIILPVLTELLL